MTTTAEKKIAGRKAPKPDAFDVAAIRNDFPLLQTQSHGKPLAYLDNAATSQKPQVLLPPSRGITPITTPTSTVAFIN